jgi:hypothetical protein
MDEHPSAWGAQAMRRYAQRGRSAEPLYSFGHWNRTSASRDIRIRKSDKVENCRGLACDAELKALDEQPLNMLTQHS